MPLLACAEKPSANDGEKPSANDNLDGEKPSANDNLTPRCEIDVDQITSAIRTMMIEVKKDMQKSQFEMEQRLLSAIHDSAGRRAVHKNAPKMFQGGDFPRQPTSESKDRTQNDMIRQMTPEGPDSQRVAASRVATLEPAQWDSEGSERMEKPGQRKKEAGKAETAMATDMRKQMSPAADQSSETNSKAINSDAKERKGMALAATTGTVRKTWQHNLWRFLSQPESSNMARAYDIFVPTFALITAGISLSQTLSEPVLPHSIARVVNFVVDAMFFAEIGLYWIVAPDRITFFFQPVNALDMLVSVSPLLIRLTSLVMQHEEVLNNAIFLGIITVLRVLKISRRLQKMLLVKEAFWQILESLPVLLYILMIIILIAAVAVYIVEDRETFPSLRQTIWFTAITMSTVGYGDMYPITPVGQGIVGVLAIMSLLYMAMPIGIIGHVFTDVWQRRDRILVCRKMQAILLQWGYRAQDLPTLFSIFDSKDVGALNFADFRRMMHQMQLGLSNERISELFQSIDRSGDGFIEEADLVRALFPGNYHEIYGFDDEEDKYCECGTLLVPYATSCRMCGAKVLRSPSRVFNTAGASVRSDDA